MSEFISTIINHPYTTLLTRVILGSVFLISGIGKLLDHAKFINVVINYQIISPSLSRLYGLLLPYAELIVAVMIIFGIYVDEGAFVALLMLISFIIAISVNLARGRKNLDCGCFGNFIERKLGIHTLLDDFALLTLSFMLLISRSRFLALDSIITSDASLPTYHSVSEVLPSLMIFSLLFGLHLIMKQFTLNISITKSKTKR